MRNWGIVVTVFYAAVVTLLFTYGAMILAEGGDGKPLLPEYFNFHETFLEGAWIPVLIVVAAQILLLFLAVDTSWRRMKPQRHAKVTAGLVGLMVATLTVSAFFALGMAHSGDDFLGSEFEDVSEATVSAIVLTIVVVIWAVWAVLFYMYSKRVSNIIDSAVGWLIKGSILELLIAVPCHIMVRQRNECCAQFVSAWGIATGIAIMLMAFGPSALFLYRRKMQDYQSRSSG